MALIRAFLNNGFFFLILIVTVTIYLIYSENVKRDHGLLNTQTSKSVNNLTDPMVPNSPLSETEIPTQTEEIAANEPINDAIKEQIEALDTPTAKEKVEVAEDIATEANKTTELELNIDVIDAQVEDAVQINNESTSMQITDTTSLVSSQEPLVKESNNVSVPDVSINQSNSQTNVDENAPMISEPLPSYNVAELNAALNESDINQPIAADAFDIETAYNLARQAFYNKEYTMAEKIYFDMLQRNPTANAFGELGNVLYANKKFNWANQAWLESAKFLVKEQRIEDAYILANRLRPVVPDTAEEIVYQLSKIVANQNTIQNRQYRPLNPSNIPPVKPYQVQPMSEMPKMQDMKSVEPMTQMPPMNSMGPSQNMQPMSPMPPMQMPPPPAAMSAYPTQPYPAAPMQRQQPMPPNYNAPNNALNYQSMNPGPPMQPMQPNMPINRTP